jgi:hypothetical protein
MYYLSCPSSIFRKQDAILVFVSRAMFNKNFYKFLMNFAAVVAAVLLFIMIVGLGVGQ